MQHKTLHVAVVENLERWRAGSPWAGTVSPGPGTGYPSVAGTGYPSAGTSSYRLAQVTLVSLTTLVSLITLVLLVMLVTGNRNTGSPHVNKSNLSSDNVLMALT